MVNSINSIISILIFTVAILLFSEQTAHAYIDPGTGSMILQAVLVALAGIAMAVKIFWRGIKNFFLRLIGKKPKKSTEINNQV